jgi:acetylornithine/succinyldiaminopimelate/putrescine aminotransferase
VAAAVGATLASLQALDAEALVRAIECTVRQNLAPALAGSGVSLSGAGAMWFLTFPSAEQAADCARGLLQAGVCIGFHNRQLRLLPPLTIRPENLLAACQKIAECGMLGP